MSGARSLRRKVVKLNPDIEAQRWNLNQEIAEVSLDSTKPLEYAMRGLVRAARALEIASIMTDHLRESNEVTQLERFVEMLRKSDDLIKRYMKEFGVVQRSQRENAQYVEGGALRTDKAVLVGLVEATKSPYVHANGKTPKKTGRAAALTPAERGRIIADLKAGKSHNEIMTATGRAASTISRIAREEKVASYRPRARGEQMDAIRADRVKYLIKQGHGDEFIARATETPIEKVKLIREGKIWK
jgi:hypothetical protein